MNPKTERAESFAARAFTRFFRLLAAAALICLAGCEDIPVTPEGSKIAMVTTVEAKAKCDQLKYIEVREQIGFDRMENADRRASNEAAAAGGDSFFVISRWFDPVAGAAVFGTALRCH